MRGKSRSIRTARSNDELLNFGVDFRGKYEPSFGTWKRVLRSKVISGRLTEKAGAELFRLELGGTEAAHGEDTKLRRNLTQSE